MLLLAYKDYAGCSYAIQDLHWEGIAADLTPCFQHPAPL